MRGKIIYQRQLHNTYLVQKECREDIVESFTGQMVLKGKLEKIAVCSSRLMDGEMEISYDISSLTDLEKAFSVKELDYNTLSHMIRQISILMDNMEKHLAEGNGIVFKPENIYINTNNSNLTFIYDFTEHHEKSTIMDFAEYCLERVDQKEERAVDLAYYFYEHARGDHFSLKEVEEYLDKKGEIKNLNDNKDIADTEDGSDIPESFETIEDFSDRRTTGNVPTVKNEGLSYDNRLSYDNPKRISTDSYLESGMYESNDKSLYSDGLKEDNDKKGNFIIDEKKVTVIPVIMVGVSILSYIVYFISSIIYVINPTLELVWISISAVLAVSGVLFYLVFRKKIDEEDKEDPNDIPVTDFDYKEEINGSENLSNTGFIRKRNTPLEEKQLWEDMVERQERRHTECTTETEDFDTGIIYRDQTVYVGKQERKNEHALVGRKRGRDVEYPIQRFPWIIGKDRERSNMQVKEDSVSRVHARITCQEGDLYLEDLASTNGTFINDLPLVPREPARLHRGDVLLFGRAEFVFE